MELQNERLFDVKERAARKWLLALLVLVVAAGFPSVWFGPRIFSHFQQARLLRHGRQSAEKDPVRAVICFRRVLGFNRDNIEATRALADIAEKFAPGEALALHERVCQLAPDSYADAQAWALAALRFGENAQAEEAFERMQKLGANTAAHHEIGARIALAAGRLADARAEAARALELEPGNAPARLELAAIEIRSPDPAAQDRARETLERLRAEPPLRHAALRALIGDRVNRGKIPEALALASEFILDPETTFEDRLQYLGILRLKGEPNVEFINSFQGGERLSLGLLKNPAGASFTSYLSQLQDEARETPGKAAALIAFLDAQGLAVLAGEWAVRIPPAIASKPPVAPPLAEAYRLSLEWQRLEDFITGANWDDFEFLRAAFLARLMQEKGDRAGASAQWAAAVNLAAYRPEKLALLVPMAAAWNWTSEWEELVWTIARSSKRPREALAALADFYRSKRDTAKLFEVWSRRLEIDPADVTAKKNWVRISVLLGSDRFRAGTMAQELYKEHPDDTEIVCTYALVQHLRERDDEAIAIMSRLTAEQLRSPAAAGYYGVFLFANNRKKEAAEFIARAKEAPFLPEEQALVDRVRRSLD